MLYGLFKINNMRVSAVEFTFEDQSQDSPLYLSVNYRVVFPAEWAQAIVADYIGRFGLL